MLRIVREVSSRRYCGVLTDIPAWRIIIPPKYEQIIIHRYGLSCKCPGENSWDAYTLEGSVIVTKCLNILFLNSDYILFSDQQRNCCIVNRSTQHAIANMHFESVLLFIGNSDTATEFNANTDVFKLCLSTDYPLNSAHIEDFLCAKFNGSWGVIDVKNDAVKMPFTNKALQHKIGNRISVLNN